MDTIGHQVKQYITEELLPDIEADELEGSTPLIRSGILDSLAILNLRAWIEETFEVGLESRELDFDSFGSLDEIERLIVAKQV